MGNSVITNTNVVLSITGGSVTNLTHNSGSLSLGGYGSLANTTILSTNPASSSTVTIGYYSPNPLYLQNLTIGTTGTITITGDTNLATYPNNVSTWELGGRIIPNITVLPNSTLNITDVSNSGTTYIKDISAGGFSGVVGTSIVRFQANRTFTFDKFFRNSSTQLLTISSNQSGVRTNLRIPVNNLGTLVHGSNPGSIYTATIQDCAVTSTNYMWFAGKNSVNAGNNSGWIFGASPTTQTNIQFFL